ncbi:helix-turn-helix domain-containing protein [Kitasatospora sp. NPDC051853]|uniref:helix-turn-helix domain-containing protein n=1 Tax=Kitasatospora sp. NPDC051853 TaxID=3364058 RepID=UPI0037A27C5F
MRRRPPTPTPVPFSPAAARAHRVGLGLTPEQVAAGMAAHGVRLLPTHVIGWESGEYRPDETEFIALARALWCPPVQLMGTAPSSLRDFRVARELTQEQAARRIGVAPRTYEQAELTGSWPGDPEQSWELAQVLGLTLRAFVLVTNRQDALEKCLRQCVDGRWQSQVKPVAKLLPVPRPVLETVLAELQQDHVVPMHWGAAPAAAEQQQPDVPPLQRFWQLLASRPTDIPV